MPRRTSASSSSGPGPHSQAIALQNMSGERTPEQSYGVPLQQLLRHRDHEEVLGGEAPEIQFNPRGCEADFIVRNAVATNHIRRVRPDEGGAEERDARRRDAAHQHTGVPVLRQVPACGPSGPM